VEQLKKSRRSGLEHLVRFAKELPAPSPREIYRRLEELGYRGQNEARRAVALMAYRHVRRIKRIYVDGVKREHLLPKSNTLLIGPTGCGKTFLVELLFQQILHLPTVIIDITTYSETGYVGQDPGTILTRLLHAADDNPLLAAVGIVCLDEFDKIASGQNNAVFAGADGLLYGGGVFFGKQTVAVLAFSASKHIPDGVGPDVVDADGGIHKGITAIPIPIRSGAVPSTDVRQSEETIQRLMDRIAFVFPGQGSQSVGMGKALSEASPAAAAVLDEADTALGEPISRLAFEGPAEQLDLTVAVTGPTGTFGYGLVPLLQADVRVSRIVGFARRPFDPAEHGWTKMAYRRGDVRDVDALREAFQGVDVVVHLAFLILGARREATRSRTAPRHPDRQAGQPGPRHDGDWSPR